MIDSMTQQHPFWKDDWPRAKRRLVQWWEHRGLALRVVAPKDEPWEKLAPPVKPAVLETAWLDPVYRARQAEYELSRTYFGGEAFPYFDTQIGPGNLATFIGSEPGFAPDTVWYNPVVDDLQELPPLRFDAGARWFQRQMAIIEEGLRIARGRFLVGMPDLIENIDTLASLRGSQEVLLDMLEQPQLVLQKVAEINQVYFDAFDAIYQRIKDEDGGNSYSAFQIWGPGRTAKLQCDASAMFSQQMFRQLVVPGLREQCRWLDYTVYHLDGTQAMGQLDALLEIEELDAIEWTPQAGIETGGHPRWYDLYRRILAAGKSVEAIGVNFNEVIPLLDAVGPKGMFIWTWAPDETTARKLLDRVETYRQDTKDSM